nr:MAG TPA: hypothetical protein [Caudoviricetes sp.]
MYLCGDSRPRNHYIVNLYAAFFMSLLQLYLQRYKPLVSLLAASVYLM